MIRHGLLLIYRNFKRFKGTFFINLIGLSSGLACVLLIYLWVNDELNIDRFLKNSDQVFHVMEHRVKADGIWTSFSSSYPMADALTADMPEVKYACTATWPQPATLSVSETVMKIKGRYCGKHYFDIFEYPLISGDPVTFLDDKNSIVISESLARKLFHSTDVIGKTIEQDHKDHFVVSGVFQDLPRNASDQFEFVIPFEKYKDTNPWLQYWGNTGTITFVRLKDGVDVHDFNKKIANYIAVKTNKEITYRTPFLKKYADIYLYGKYDNGKPAGGRITYVKLFSVIAVFILVIACINFMNLSTAKASARIKEVGIKKAVGAGRRTLVFHYISESLLMSILSMLLALLLVDIFLGQFNEITGKQLSLDFSTNFIFSSVVLCLIAGLIAGSYPAFYLSRFNAAAVLKGKFNSSLGELWARKGLVIFQFTLSVVLIVSVIIVYKQIEFIQSTSLGYDKENILYFHREGKLEDNQILESFLTEIKNIPGVINASSISHNMTGHNSGTWGVQWPGRDPEDRTEFENVTVNYDMMETLGIQMKEGRTFSRNSPSDTAKIIFNETAIKFMGLKNPIGAMVKLWGKDMQIIGVTNDFHYESLHEKFKPAFFRLAPDNTYMIMLKIARGRESETIKRLSQLYSKVNPGFSFGYEFLDAQYQSQYVAEQRVSVLSQYFAGLAVLISCLGLFGLASFTAQRRLKEIGIRKVLGSTELGIIYLLSSDFTKIVAIAIVIALPLSFFVIRLWLENFAFRIPLKWWYFAGAGTVALFISWLTVGAQALRASRINPTQCLKDE